MKYIDLFAGVGGFRYGIEKAYNSKHAHIGEKPKQEECEQGREWTTDEREVFLHTRDGSAPLCVYSNEWDKYANSVYRRHYGECDIRDIRTVEAGELPDFDLLCGGFPCQAFSVAGKRGGFDDTRGTLFFEIARICKERKPRYLLLENVKGLLSHDQGRTFSTILGVLSDLGYDVQWQVLNSKDFGVPQNRERVYIVGNLRGEPRPQIFPLTDFNPKALKYVGGILSEKAKMWLDNGKQFSRNFPQGSRVYKSSGVASTLASQAGGLGAKTGLYMVDDPSRKDGIEDKNISPTLRREAHGNVPAVVIPVLTPDRVTKRQNGRRFKTDGEPSFTLTGQDRHGIFDGMKIRKLTPTECERLQGFPDGWTLEGVNGETMSDSRRYMMMGNAVSTTVVTAIIKRFLYDKNL